MKTNNTNNYPLIASSLALALSFNVAMAAEPSISYGVGNPTKTLSDPLRFNWDTKTAGVAVIQNAEEGKYKGQEIKTLSFTFDTSRKSSLKPYYTKDADLGNGAFKFVYGSKNPENKPAILKFDAGKNSLKQNLGIDLGSGYGVNARSIVLNLDGEALGTTIGGTAGTGTTKYSLVGNLDISIGENASYDATLKESMKGNITLKARDIRNSSGSITFKNGNLEGNYIALMPKDPIDSNKTQDFKVDSTYNLTFGTKDTPANTKFTANDITTEFGNHNIDFYGNGELQTISASNSTNTIATTTNKTLKFTALNADNKGTNKIISQNLVDNTAGVTLSASNKGLNHISDDLTGTFTIKSIKASQSGNNKVIFSKANATLTLGSDTANPARDLTQFITSDNANNTIKAETINFKNLVISSDLTPVEQEAEQTLQSSNLASQQDSKIGNDFNANAMNFTKANTITSTNKATNDFNATTITFSSDSTNTTAINAGTSTGTGDSLKITPNGKNIFTATTITWNGNGSNAHTINAIGENSTNTFSAKTIKTEASNGSISINANSSAENIFDANQAEGSINLSRKEATASSYLLSANAGKNTLNAPTITLAGGQSTLYATGSNGINKLSADTISIQAKVKALHSASGGCNSLNATQKIEISSSVTSTNSLLYSEGGKNELVAPIIELKTTETLSNGVVYASGATASNTLAAQGDITLSATSSKETSLLVAKGKATNTLKAQGDITLSDATVAIYATNDNGNPNGGSNILNAKNITITGKGGGTDEKQAVISALWDRANNKLTANEKIVITLTDLTKTAIISSWASNTLEAKEIKIVAGSGLALSAEASGTNTLTASTINIAGNIKSISSGANTLTFKTGIFNGTIEAKENNSKNTFIANSQGSIMTADNNSDLTFSGSGTNQIQLKGANTTLSITAKQDNPTLKSLILDSNATIQFRANNTKFSAEKIEVKAGKKLTVDFNVGRNAHLNSSITNNSEIHLAIGEGFGIIDKPITGSGTITAKLWDSDKTLLWIKNPDTALKTLEFQNGGNARRQTLSISSKENAPKAGGHIYNLLSVGDPKNPVPQDPAPTGLKGNEGIFRVFIGEQEGVLGQGDNKTKYSKAYADRVVIHSLNSTTPTQLKASVFVDSPLSTLSKITYQQGGENNIAVFTVANQTPLETLAEVAKPQAPNTPQPPTPLVDLQAEELDFGGEKIVVNLETEQTDMYGKSDTSIAPKDYTTYFIGGIQSQGLDTSIKDLYSTALMLNYDLYIANFNSLNKRLGELRANPNSHGVWARIFGGEQSNDFGIGSKTKYITTQAGYDYAFGLNGANNYLGFALSYAHSNSTSNIANHSSKQTFLDDISSNAFEFAVYNSYVADGVSLEDLKNGSWDKGFYSDTILKLALIQSDFSFSNATSTKSTTNNIGLVFSQEVGYMMKFGEEKQWGITPLYELGFGYLSSGEFKREIQGSSQKATQEALLNLRNKVGVVWSYNIDELALGRKDQNASIYLGTAYEYDYIKGGENSFSTAHSQAQSGSSSLRSDERFVLNLGSNITLNKDTRLYVDIEKSFKGKINTDLQFNFGARYSFGENTSYKPLPKTSQTKAPLKVEEKEAEKTEEKKEEKK